MLILDRLGPGWRVVEQRHADGQAIVIAHPAGPVTVRVVSVVRGRVKLGIEAPESVRVNREEVWEARAALGREET